MPDPEKKTLSATEVPALFGVSPYLTRWMLYKKFADDVSLDSEADARMSWGKLMQPLLLKQAAADLRLEVRPNEAETYVRNGWLGCTRDAEVICPDRGPGALECKCVFDYGTWMREWSGGKRPPRQHEIQLQVQMYCGDGEKPYHWGILVAWVGAEMKYFEREPIGDLWDEMHEAATRFFDDVANKREPNPFGLIEVETALLGRLYPVKLGRTIDLTKDPRADELVSQAQLLNYHAAERASHSKAEKAIRSAFKALMVDAEVALLPSGVQLRQQQVNRAGYTVKPSSYSTIEAFVPDAPVVPDAPPLQPDQANKLWPPI